MCHWLQHELKGARRQRGEVAIGWWDLVAEIAMIVGLRWWWLYRWVLLLED